MKKGFTLIEMVAVIGIIALIAVVSLPAVLNQFKEKQGDVSLATKKIIYNAAELYMDDRPSTFSKNYSNIGKKCYVYLDTLVMAGKLSSPIKDVTTSQEISLTSYVQATVNNYSDFDEFVLVTPDDRNYRSVTEGCN